MSKLVNCFLAGMLLHSATVLASPIIGCEDTLFNGIEPETGKELTVCKKGEYIDFFFGKSENLADTIHFDVPIEQTGWGEDINRSGDTHTVMTLLNGIDQYGVYFNVYDGKKDGGIILYNEEGGRDFIPLDIATVDSKLGPHLSDIGVDITHDF